MYTEAFQTINTAQIVDSVKQQGYFVFEGAITDQYIQEMFQEVDFDSILLNTNDVGVVLTPNQKFLTHCLGQSKKAFDLITSDRVLDICNHYFEDRYQLINHRIYQTHKASHMPWHTDNNRQVGRQLDSKHNLPGLLFLLYLSDVTKNPFQCIKNSHLWSQKYSHEIYLSDQFIEDNYQSEVLTFQMKKGSLMICNIHCVHRAEPFQDKNYSRSTLLFQVDQVGSDNLGHGEKHLIDTGYLDHPTPEVLRYLGFGYRTQYPAFPNTSAATMSVLDILRLQRQLFPLMLQAISKNLMLTLLPGSVIITLKRIQWQLKSTQKSTQTERKL
ncbi:MAG: phytanoyl-CoA dioxygenase family protein [Microcoleaceae cyanobacterium]